MSRLALQALMMWDDPRLFEDQAFYQQLHQLVTTLIANNGAITNLTATERNLINHLVAGSMDAVSASIKNNANSNSSAQLVEILEDLLKFSEKLTQHNSLH